MEVHKHPHHPAHSKKWFEYLLEFLLLFLAVYLGFIAENIRENRQEHERAKQYLVSLYEDLKVDTAKMASLLEFDDEKIKYLVQMRPCYETVSHNLTETSCLGPIIKYSKTNRSFHITNRTLTQLANAGGFRLLPEQDADSILLYESMFRQYENFQETLFQSAQDNVRNTLNVLADFRVNASIQNNVPLVGRDTTTIVLSGPLLFNKDRLLLNKWFNELTLYLRVIKGQRKIISDLYLKASNLISFYKKEYNYK